MKQLLVKIPMSQSIQEVIDYIYYSEMEGREDETDSWYTTYKSLLELKEKVLEVKHYTDNLMHFKTTRDPGTRFRDGEFLMNKIHEFL